MKLAKRLTALLLALVLVLSFAACSKTTTEQPTPDTANTDTPADTQQETKDTPAEETAEPIVLEWYYRGNGIQKDTELVETEFNKLLQTYPGMENVTVHLNCYTGADYPNAVSLVQSVGTQIDILNTVGLDFVD